MIRALIAAALGIFLCGVAPSSHISITPHCGEASSGGACIVISPLTLDFDGDGSAESVGLLSEPNNSREVGDAHIMVISTLWGDAAQPPAKRRGVLIISFSKSGKVFNLAESEGYFDTPIWHSKPLPISVAKRGSKAFKEFQVQEHRIKNDILVLGTEAGIDTALYWNGKTFKLFAPAEEP